MNYSPCYVSSNLTSCLHQAQCVIRPANQITIYKCIHITPCIQSTFLVIESAVTHQNTYLHVICTYINVAFYQSAFMLCNHSRLINMALIMLSNKPVVKFKSQALHAATNWICLKGKLNPPPCRHPSRLFTIHTTFACGIYHLKMEDDVTPGL